MAQHWRPGAENFFDRIKKAQILSIPGNSIPRSPCAGRGQEAELATAAARLCSGDTIIEPEIKAKALAWVPDAMRFDGVAGDPAEGGHVVDDVAEDADDLPLDAANQNDADARSAKRPDPQPRTATEPILLPRQSGRRMAPASKARIRRRPSHEAPSRHLRHRHRPACRRDRIRRGEWRMPWHHSGAPVMRPTSVAGRRYSGINRLVLWATADACGYASGIWATYQQWRAHGGQVRKGEIGTHVILWKKVERGDAAAEAGAEGDSRARFFARSFVVFNRDQVDGAEEAAEKEVAPISTSVADALAFLEGLGVPVEYGLRRLLSS
jgi:hypothetical protein